MKPSERLERWEDMSPMEFVSVRKEVAKLEAENKTQQTALTFIVDIGYDYDGFGKVDSLKKLIDEMVGYARNPQSAVDALTGGDDET